MSKSFSRKLVPLKKNQESIGCRNQTDAGVDRKHKITQSFLEPTESHKYISLNFEV